MECDWSDFYANTIEVIPPNALKPLGKGATLCMFMDSNHAGDLASGCSQTDFVIFFNHGMIDWLSKKQSVFGTEFCAM